MLALLSRDCHSAPSLACSCGTIARAAPAVYLPPCANLGRMRRHLLAVNCRVEHNEALTSPLGSTTPAQFAPPCACAGLNKVLRSRVSQGSGLLPADVHAYSCFTMSHCTILTAVAGFLVCCFVVSSGPPSASSESVHASTADPVARTCQVVHQARTPSGPDPRFWECAKKSLTPPLLPARCCTISLLTCTASAAAASAPRHAAQTPGYEPRRALVPALRTSDCSGRRRARWEAETIMPPAPTNAPSRRPLSSNLKLRLLSVRRLQPPRISKLGKPSQTWRAPHAFLHACLYGHPLLGEQ